MKLIVGHRASGILFRYVKYVGGKWLLPANVCPVVPFTFVEAQVPFEFVDIDRKTFCIDENIVLNKICNDETITGIVYVHTYGCERNINNFVSCLRGYRGNIKVVDDRCLCRPDIGCTASTANMLLFSTGYAKYVDLGKGGYAWLQDQEDIFWEDTLFEQDTIEDYYKDLQINNKLFLPNEKPTNWLNAGILHDDAMIQRYMDDIQIKLPLIDRHKQLINEVYCGISQYETLGTNLNQWRYSLWVEQKNKILSNIFSAGLFASSHYLPSSRFFTNELFPNAEWLYAHIINLFNDLHISIDQARCITDIVNKI